MSRAFWKSVQRAGVVERLRAGMAGGAGEPEVVGQALLADGVADAAVGIDADRNAGAFEGALHVVEVTEDRVAHRLVGPVGVDAEIDGGARWLAGGLRHAERLFGVVATPLVFERAEAVVEMLEDGADAQALAEDDLRFFRLQVLARQAWRQVRVVAEDGAHTMGAQRAGLCGVETLCGVGDEREARCRRSGWRRRRCWNVWG